MDMIQAPESMTIGLNQSSGSGQQTAGRISAANLYGDTLPPPLTRQDSMQQGLTRHDSMQRAGGHNSVNRITNGNNHQSICDNLNLPVPQRMLNLGSMMNNGGA